MAVLCGSDRRAPVNGVGGTRKDEKQLVVVLLSAPAWVGWREDTRQRLPARLGGPLLM
jgi:hypothetical protein